MLQRMLLCLIVVLSLASLATAAPAAPDAAFDRYLSSVSGLDGAKTADAKKAAQAFVVYLQSALPGAKKALAGHADYPVRVAGKNTPKAAFVKNLDTIFNDFVVSRVRGVKPDAEMIVRNQVEYGIADGVIWFTFTDDDVKKPVIFAINNTPL